MDNDGLPHTLEHLVFLGSEDYPYKEVLDLLANRALADRWGGVTVKLLSWSQVHLHPRTNAWTDTDHTCYTVYTAGPSGFLSILPVYMDHILHPTLRWALCSSWKKSCGDIQHITVQRGGLPDRGAPHQRRGPGCRSGLQRDAGGSNKNHE